mgnify:CR=1 FL=1
MINFQLTSDESQLVQGYPNTGIYIIAYCNQKMIAGQWSCGLEEIEIVSSWMRDTYTETQWLACAHFNGHHFNLVFATPTGSLTAN